MVVDAPGVVLPDELVTGEGREGTRAVATESNSISSGGAGDVATVVMR